MNRKILLVGLLVVVPLLGLLGFGLRRDPHQIESPLIGLKAPPFSLRPAGGGAPVTLADLAGKRVVLNFWATWCGPCFEEHPVLVEAARAVGSDVRFVGVVYEDEEPNVLEYLRQQGSSYPSLIDPGSRTAIAYGVYGVPETFFIDPQGVIVAKQVGPLSPETLQARLVQAQGSAR